MKKGFKIAMLLVGAFLITETAVLAGAWFGWGSRPGYHRYHHPWRYRRYHPWGARSGFGISFNLSDSGGDVSWKDLRNFKKEVIKIVRELQENQDNIVEDQKEIIRRLEILEKK